VELGRMASEAKKDNLIADPPLGVAGSPNHRPGGGRRQPPPANRAEGRLRFEVAELQARLAEVTRCLEAAENRTAEVVRARDELAAAAADLDRRMAVIVASRSWRMTGSLRAVGRRLRSLFKG